MTALVIQIFRQGYQAWHDGLPVLGVSLYDACPKAEVAEKFLRTT